MCYWFWVNCDLYFVTAIEQEKYGVLRLWVGAGKDGGERESIHRGGWDLQGTLTLESMSNC